MEEQKKRGIIRAATLTASALVAMNLMQVLAGKLIRLLLPLLGTFDAATGTFFLSNTSAAYYFICVADYFFMFSVPIALLLFTNLSRADEMIRLKGKNATLGDVLPAAFVFLPMLLGAAHVASAVTEYLSQFYALFGIGEEALFSNVPTTPLGFLADALLLCVAAPVCEELLFRGVLLNLLKPYGYGFAIVAQALLFSVYHGTLTQMLYTAVGGMVFGYLAARYGGILPSLILHILNNAVSLFIGPLCGLFGEAQMLVSLLVCIVYVLGGLLFLIIKAKRDRALFRLPADEDDAFASLRRFFFSPAMLVYLILSAYLLAVSLL